MPQRGMKVDRAMCLVAVVVERYPQQGNLHGDQSDDHVTPPGEVRQALIMVEYQLHHSILRQSVSSADYSVEAINKSFTATSLAVSRPKTTKNAWMFLRGRGDNPK
jgi:hypothetical protein